MFAKQSTKPCPFANGGGTVSFSVGEQGSHWLALSQLPNSKTFDSSLDSSWIKVGQSISMIKCAHLMIVGVLAKTLKKEYGT